MIVIQIKIIVSLIAIYLFHQSPVTTNFSSSFNVSKCFFKQLLGGFIRDRPQIEVLRCALRQVQSSLAHAMHRVVCTVQLQHSHGYSFISQSLQLHAHVLTSAGSIDVIRSSAVVDLISIGYMGLAHAKWPSQHVWFHLEDPVSLSSQMSSIF